MIFILWGESFLNVYTTILESGTTLEGRKFLVGRLQNFIGKKMLNQWITKDFFLVSLGKIRTLQRATNFIFFSPQIHKINLIFFFWKEYFEKLLVWHSTYSAKSTPPLIFIILFIFPWLNHIRVGWSRGQNSQPCWCLNFL